MTNTAETEYEDLLEWLGVRSISVNESGTPAGSNIYGKSANAISSLLAENARLREAASRAIDAMMSYEDAADILRAALHGDPQ